jgi:hypothetical protein
MASEGRGWDTSTAFIRRTFRACIDAGRRAGGREGADLWEAYRLLGTGMHTMEDLLAHSNWCEIALRKMGHQEVFCHVGDNGNIEIFCAHSWFINCFQSLSIPPMGQHHHSSLDPSVASILLTLSFT